MKKFSKGLLTAAVFLVGVPAAALYGGGRGPTSGWYRGAIPTSWFTSTTFGTEKCFPATIETDYFASEGIREVRINPQGVQNDGNPQTFLRCTDHANLNTLTCEAGFADGTVIACADTNGPKKTPGPNDRVYIVADESGSLGCDIVIASPYGEINPSCRTPTGDSVYSGATGTGGTGGTGGSSGVTGLSCASGPSTVSGSQFTSTTNGCYAFPKTGGTLKFGNWTGASYTVVVKDPVTGTVTGDKVIPTGTWTDVPGVNNGTVYFQVKNAVSMQVDAWQ